MQEGAAHVLHRNRVVVATCAALPSASHHVRMHCYHSNAYARSRGIR